MDIKSLDERASEWAKWQMSAQPYPESGTKEQKEMWQMSYDARIEDYKDIAKEQCEIDIQRACEMHCKLCEHYCKCNETAWGYEKTCDEREQIKQAMKGE